MKKLYAFMASGIRGWQVDTTIGTVLAHSQAEAYGYAMLVAEMRYPAPEWEPRRAVVGEVPEEQIRAAYALLPAPSGGEGRR